MHSRHSSTRPPAVPGGPTRAARRPGRRAARRRRLVSVCVAVALTLVAGFLLGGREKDAASATAIAADFDRGNIISDAAFYDGYALTDGEIQNFLNSRGANCVAGQQPCLKDFVATSIAKSADSYCRGYTGGLSQTAAQILGGVGRSCGISPKVLIVLLDKEQGLVSGTRPSTYAYTHATGFACPDTSGCDSAYSGFFSQVYTAAWQFQKYTLNPNDPNYHYHAGQVNWVYYNPNFACGGSNMYIANQATANLYIYTPYQPNAAAMNNLYGTGDGCSAYGNRNFWRMFTDYFGSPQAGSYLVRTVDNGTVYLLAGTSKYPIGDMATVGSLAPLGSVGYVSQQYLDRRTTGRMMSRIVLAQDGTVYFIDSGIKLPFASCGQVADYGGDCGSLITLPQTEIDAFTTGPFVTPIYHTTSGKQFYISGGVKREVVDTQALTQAGLPTNEVWLKETGIGSLPYGAPVTRDGVAMTNRSTGAVTVAAGGTFTVVSDKLRTATSLASLPVRPMDDASLRQLTISATLTSPIAAQSGSSAVYLLTAQGKVALTDPDAPPASPVPAQAAFLALLPNSGTIAAGQFVKGTGSGTIFDLQGGELRPIGNWTDLVNLAGGNPTPTFWTYDQKLVDLLPQGPTQLGPATLAVAPSNATVYFVNGKDELIPLGSFLPATEIGATRMDRVTDAGVAKYTIRNSGLPTAIDCGGVDYLGLGGKLYRVGSDVAADYGLTYTALDPLACGALPKAATGLTRFLRGPDGTIYYVESGTKRPIRSFATYLGLGGTAANTIQAGEYGLRVLPTGALY